MKKNSMNLVKALPIKGYVYYILASHSDAQEKYVLNNGSHVGVCLISPTYYIYLNVVQQILQLAIMVLTVSREGLSTTNIPSAVRPILPPLSRDRKACT